MSIPKVVHLGIPLFIHVDDLAAGEIFPGLNIHISFGLFDQPHGVFRHQFENSVLVNLYPSFCVVVHERIEELCWCWLRYFGATQI